MLDVVIMADEMPRSDMATYDGITYENGSVPMSVLAPLDGQPQAFLRKDAADAWNRAKAEALRKTGILLTVRGWNRTMEEQRRFFFERYQPQAVGGGPFGDVRWYQDIRYVRVRGAAAAIPGTSNHGLGLAVDVNDYGGVGEFGNARRVATFPILARHGWTDSEGRGPIREPWHLVYNPASDTHPQEEDDMFSDEDRALLRAAAKDARAAHGASDWSKARLAGTIKRNGEGERVDPSISDDLNAIRTHLNRARDDIKELQQAIKGMAAALNTLADHVRQEK